MLQKTLAAVIVARLVLAPSAVADEPMPRPGPIAAAALEAARTEAPVRREPMSKALKWTGIGLLAGSPLPIAVARFGDCIPQGPACGHRRRQGYAYAGLLAGTGALLLVIGEAKRGPELPTVSMEDGRSAVVQRVSF